MQSVPENLQWASKSSQRLDGTCAIAGCESDLSIEKTGALATLTARFSSIASAEAVSAVSEIAVEGVAFPVHYSPAEDGGHVLQGSTAVASAQSLFAEPGTQQERFPEAVAPATVAPAADPVVDKAQALAQTSAALAEAKTALAPLVRRERALLQELEDVREDKEAASQTVATLEATLATVRQELRDLLGTE